MALTNIANIDALDSIIGINAADEDLAKEFLKEAHWHFNDSRRIELFYGQMQADAQVDVGNGDWRIWIESPTVRVRFYQTGADMTRVQTYLYVDSEWVLSSEVVLDGSFSADGT